MLAWSPDSKRLAATNANSFFRMWDVASERVLHSSDLNSVRSGAFSPDGKLFCEQKQTLIACKEIDTGQTAREFKRPHYWFGKITFSSDGVFLAASATNSLYELGRPSPTIPDQFMVKVWNMRTGEEAATLLGHVQGIESLSFSPDRRTLATGSADGTVKLWSVETWQELLTLPIVKEHGGVRVGFSPDGRLLVTAALNQLKLWYAR